MCRAVGGNIFVCLRTYSITCGSRVADTHLSDIHCTCSHMHLIIFSKVSLIDEDRILYMIENRGLHWLRPICLIFWVFFLLFATPAPVLSKVSLILESLHLFVNFNCNCWNLPVVLNINKDCKKQVDKWDSKICFMWLFSTWVVVIQYTVNDLL